MYNYTIIIQILYNSYMLHFNYYLKRTIYRELFTENYLKIVLKHLSQVSI